MNKFIFLPALQVALNFSFDRQACRSRFTGLALVISLLCFASSASAKLDLSVQIVGIDGPLRNNVLQSLSVESQKNDPDLTDNQLRRLHQKAESEIRTAMEPLGYYSAVVRGNLTQSEGAWTARYEIEPGPPILIQNRDIQIEGEGANDAAFQKLVKGFRLQPGDILNHQHYEDAKRALQRLAAERGYLDAELGIHEVRVRVERHEADIHLRFNTGPRYHFGEVIFHQDIIDPIYLERFVTFKPGDPYSTEKLFDLQGALNDSDYFANVEVRALRESAQNLLVPIEANLEPRKKNRYTAGLGYGTDTGARSSLGWTNRRVNRKGHRFKSLLRFSEIQNSLTGSYVIPIRNPRTDQFELTTSWMDDNTPTSESETFIYGVSRSLSRRAGWLETLYLNYRTDSYVVGAESGKTNLLMPGISFAHINADDRIYTLRGHRLALDFRGSHPALGSDVQFLQLTLWAKVLRQLGAHGRFIMRGETGITRLASDNTLPPSLRFFAGGDQSVRGYKYQALGPRDASGKVVGGQQMLVASVEYEYRFSNTFSGAVFLDAGNAVNDWPEAKLQKGAGFGVRWKTPIGLIRLDLAKPLDETDKAQYFHLVVGPDL